MFSISPGIMIFAVPLMMSPKYIPSPARAETFPVAFSRPVTMTVAFSPSVIGSAVAAGVFLSFFG